MSCQEIAKLTGRTLMGVRDSIRRLKLQQRVYIGRFDRQHKGTRGRCVPMYYVGCAPDAEEPPPRPRLEVNADYRERHSAAIHARNRARQGKSLGLWSGLGARG